MAVVHESIDESRGHHVIAEDLAPLLETFIGCKHRGRVLVAARWKVKSKSPSCLTTDSRLDAQLDRILQSQAVAQAPMLRRLLQYLLEHTLR